MKIAICSDIHGNLEAFENFLGELPSDIERIYCAGDLTGLCSNNDHDIAKCIRLVNEKCDRIVYGNHDTRWRNDYPFSAFDYEPGGPKEKERISNAYSDTEINIMNNLPEKIEEDGIVMAHANPFAQDLNFCGYPAQNYVPSQHVTKFFKDAKNEIILYGHTHDPHICHLGKFRTPKTKAVCINPGSLGIYDEYAIYDTYNRYFVDFRDLEY